MIVRCLSLAVLLTLSACKDSDGTALTDKAEGEILPGSVSDAMLPLDTVRSQPPLAPHTEAVRGARESIGEGSEASDVTPESAASDPASVPVTPQAVASATE